MPAPILLVSPSPTGADLHAAYVDAKGAVYVAGASGTLLKSADRGATWKPLAHGITGDIHGLWGTGTDVYAGADDDQIFVSNDAGATWRTATPKTGRTTAILAGAAASATDVTAVGVNGVIVHSTDRGKTWTVENTEAMGYAANYGIAYGGGGGKGTISRFVVGDGGSSNAVIDGTWYGGGSSGDGGWRALTTGPAGFVAVGEQGRITRFDPAGAPTEVTPRVTDRILRGVWRDGQTLVAVGDALGNRATALRSTDGGVRWVAVDAKTDRHLGAIAGTARDLWAVGDGGAAVHSTDAGATWAAASARPLAAREVRTIAGDGKALVASGGGIARSTDGGKTWTQVRDSANTLVVAAAGGLVAADPVTGIERSTDGGATWNKLAAAPRSGSWRSIAATGAAIAIVDGDTTLLSPDGGATWGRAAPQAVECVWASGGALWVAGKLGSVIRSTDAGKTWTPLPFATETWQSALWFDGSALVVGSARGELWRGAL